MKQFNLEDYKKNPDQILVLEHYKDPAECWIIRDAEIAKNKRLAVRVPDTGYQTEEVVIADGDAICDKDGNMVGYLKIAESGERIKIPISELVTILELLNIGQSVDFSCEEGEDFWGVRKVQGFDCDTILIGSWGGGETVAIDLVHKYTPEYLEESVKQALRDHTDDFIYWEVTKPEPEEETEITLLFSADAWHSTSSKELVAVFSDRNELEEYLSEMENQGELTDEDIAMLYRIDQTQGRDLNYSITTEKINPRYDNGNKR